jgi:uncharacterized membrane protein YagU involved in acid resistance
MNAKRATAAGVIGTAVITALWQVEPAIGLPRIAVGHILSTFMAVSVAHLNVGIAGGWVVHFIVGILLALLYAGLFAERLAGSPVWRGATYGVLVFILAQALFMPLVGGGFFSRGDVELLLGSLLGHIAYGIVVGWIYDLPPAQVRATTAPRMA